MFKGPANYSEYQNIRQQLEVEKMPGRFPGDPPRNFHQLYPSEQAQQEKKRLAGNDLDKEHLQLFFGQESYKYIH